MSNSWNSTLLHGGQFETTCTSLACPMILFGHTHAKVQASEGDPYPSWILHACGYVGSYALGIFTFAAYGVPFLHAVGINVSPQVVQSIATGCGSACLGMYAGKKREKIRSKYGIHGSRFTDCMVHTLISPCALCQEANQITYNQNGPLFVPGGYIPVEIEEPFKK